MTADVPAPRRPEHIVRLDVLRAIAIIGVVVFHYDLNLRAWEQAGAGRPPGALAETFHEVAAYGSSGVALFFVISGFCIHLSYLRHRATFQTRDFYWRRFLRIYPAYFVALLFFSALGVFKIMSSLNLKMFLSHLFLVHDFFDLPVLLGINAAFWSLAVEWQFYLLFPFLLWLGARTSLKTCLLVSAMLCVLSQILCSLFPAFGHFTQEQHCLGRALFTWCDWILGACLAEAYEQRLAFFRPRYLWLPLGAVLFLSISFLHLTFETRFLVQALFYAIWMEFYLSLASPLVWIERLLVPVGLVSYSIYLWHMPLVKALFGWLHARIALPKGMIAEGLVFLPLTLLLLSPLFVASYWLLEIRLPRWIAHWRRRQLASRSV